MLMIEVDGPDSAMEQSVLSVSQAAETDGLLAIKTARTPNEIKALWATRSALSPALRNVAPKKINEDVVVPVSHIPDLIAGLDRLGKLHDITIVNFGHAGNGNIHVNLLVNPDNQPELERSEACLDEIFSLVIRLGGTLSGEHGIGLVKRDFIGRELDRESLQLMRQIKAVFDPRNILNPGKMLPVEAFSQPSLTPYES